MSRVPRLLLSKQAVTDTERLAAFLRGSDPVGAQETTELLISALSILRHHPLVGRPAEAGLRELVISRGRTGYLAFYGYDEATDRVIVYAIRHQREAGYAAPSPRAGVPQRLVRGGVTHFQARQPRRHRVKD